jgi:hypothetical protein
MRTWSSAVYDHFKPPEIVRDGADVKYVFVCKRYVKLHTLLTFLLIPSA